MNRPSDSLHRLALPTRLSESHGRTDGRTDVEATDVTASVTSVTRAGGATANVNEGERFPVIRTGERPEIALDVRRAVYRRDGYRCKFCGNTYGETRLDLDHIIPWSAGGPDASTNLRTLCQRCNEDRSNFRLFGDSGRVLPVTWWCIDCHSADGEYDYWVTIRPTWVRSEPPRIESREGLTFAYCARCDINGYAEVVL